MKVFHRKDLAKRMSDVILSDGITGASSGLFLAAPRRTGKSTFLREDLRPFLEDQGLLVLYIDLWSDRKKDPGDVISEAVLDALRAKKLGAKIFGGIDNIEVSALGVGLSVGKKSGAKKSVTLRDAFMLLSENEKKKIVLMIDEAQHALTTEKGSDALFALKAARDELNSSKFYGLRIVATGSNRDKLALLKNSKDQAFFGAPLANLEKLNKNYSDWFADHVHFPETLDKDFVWGCFEQTSFRPEFLASAADSVRLDLLEGGISNRDIQEKFAFYVNEHLQNNEQEILKNINALPKLQYAVLCTMAFLSENFAPFDEKTIGHYKKILKNLSQEKTEISNTSIQNSLTSLQEKGFVWKEKRGSYSLEESSIKDILNKHSAFDVFKSPFLLTPKRYV